MVGRRHQQRPCGRRGLAQARAWSRRSCLAMIGTRRADRREAPRRCGPVPATARRSPADALASQQRAHRPPHHRLAARSGSAPSCPCRTAAAKSSRPGPRSGEHDRGIASRLEPGDDLPPRAACSVICASRTAWKIRLTSVHQATSTRPASGRPNSKRRDEDHHVRVAPRGDQPELAVERPPDVDFHAVEALDRQALDHPLRDIAADDHPQHHGRVDRRRAAARRRRGHAPTPTTRRAGG